MAEVKAPRSWPKSSLSISSEGMAAQLTSTKGPEARLLLAWSQRATSSLPVPFSPVMRVRVSKAAIRSTTYRTLPMAFDEPMIGCTDEVRVRRARPIACADMRCLGSGVCVGASSSE